MDEADLTQQHLDVYDTRNGPWTPEHGEVAIPDDWEFLPTGDAYLMRTVKAAGVYWHAWRPRGRNRQHRRKLGLWAPAETIARARETAEQTATRREHARQQSARQRARAEDNYRSELAEAILEYLSFHPAHGQLASDIAAGAARQAAEIGSGRVGRVQALTVPERAELAARAWIRHRYTNYDDQLASVIGDDLLVDELAYRDIKSSSHNAVDDFLASHRHS